LRGVPGFDGITHDRALGDRSRRILLAGGRGRSPRVTARICCATAGHPVEQVVAEIEARRADVLRGRALWARCDKFGGFAGKDGDDEELRKLLTLNQ
jgi:hypothetical protein